MPVRSPGQARARAAGIAILLGIASVGCGGGTATLDRSPATVPTMSTPPATTSPATTTTTTPLPVVGAKAWAVYDLGRGQLMAESAADTPLAVGSLMKLLTAYVVTGAGEPTKVVTVPGMSLDPLESAIGLYPGEQLPRDVLLRAMLIVSANDAARALAIDVAGSEAAFVTMMNDAAARIGLIGTRAANPIGLDAAGQHSTARDMVTLGSVLMADPTFRATVARRDARLHGQVFSATNDLLGAYAGADGIKTGHTSQAGYCLLASATRGGRTVIVAVLGAPSKEGRNAAASALLDWAFAN